MAQISGRTASVGAGGATAILTVLGEQVGNLSATAFTLLLMTSALIPAIYFIFADGAWRTVAERKKKRHLRLQFITGLFVTTLALSVGITYLIARPAPIEYQLMLTEIHDAGDELRRRTVSNEQEYKKFAEDYNRWLYHTKFWIGEKMSEAAERQFVSIGATIYKQGSNDFNKEHARIRVTIAGNLQNLAEIMRDPKWQ